MKLYIKKNILTIKFTDRRLENLKWMIGTEDDKTGEIEKKPFYIFIEFVNGESETIADDNSVIYFESERKALEWFTSKLI